MNEAEDGPHRRAETAMRDAREPVGVVRERHLEQQAAEQRERDEREESAVREAEGVADVGGEDAERGLVELVRPR